MGKPIKKKTRPIEIIVLVIMVVMIIVTIIAITKPAPKPDMSNIRTRAGKTMNVLDFTFDGLSAIYYVELSDHSQYIIVSASGHIAFEKVR